VPLGAPGGGSAAVPASSGHPVERAQMAERKAFLLRLDPRIHDAVKRWADDDLRSVNAQIEFLLRKALAQAGRRKMDAEK